MFRITINRSLLTKCLLASAGISFVSLSISALIDSENPLLKKSTSKTIMTETTLFYDEVEKEYPNFFSRYSPRLVSEKSIESKFVNDIPKFLDLDNPYYGWTTVLKIYKNTLGRMSVSSLISNCRDLAKGNYYSIDRIEYIKRREAAKKFCSFPDKVKEKISTREVYKYRQWDKKSVNNKFLDKVKSREVPEIVRIKGMDNDKYCRWFMNNYTVYGEMTLEEIDFIKSCYLTLLESN